MLNLKLKPEITVEETKEAGLAELTDATRIARGIDWEIWADSLNFILKEGNSNSYFSDFEALLKYLYSHKVKFYLTKGQWLSVENSIQQATDEISRICKQCEISLNYIAKKYNIANSNE